MFTAGLRDKNTKQDSMNKNTFIAIFTAKYDNKLTAIAIDKLYEQPTRAVTTCLITDGAGAHIS